MFTVIITALVSIFNGILTPLVKIWADVKTQQIKSNEAGFEAGALSDAANLKAMAEAEIQNNALKVQVWGSPVYRFVTMVVGIPVAIHFSLIFVDTILSSKFLYGHGVLGIPDPPSIYIPYEWYIISSFFLIHAVNVGTSNVSQWLNRK